MVRSSCSAKFNTYWRESALEIGALVDVSEMAKELWVEHRTVITAAIWNIICDIPEGSGETIQDRQWDLLWKFRVSTIKERGPSYHFKCSFRANEKEQTRKLTALLQKGDDGETVITIMLEEEG
jgi:hypothetical protein